MEEKDAMETKMCYIERLPDELLSMVLRYLNTFDVVSAAHVSRRWQHIASCRALLVLKPNDAYRASILNKQLLVTSRDADLRKIFYTTQNLHTLIAHERVRFDIGMLSELKKLLHLVHLDIFTAGNILTAQVNPIAERLHTLVFNDERVQEDVILSLTKSSRLVQLHMYGYTAYYPQQALVELIKTRQNYLTELTLRCKTFRSYEGISRCINLTALRLYSCKHLKPETAVALISNLSKLRVLHLTGTTELWSKKLRDLIAVLPNSLEELSLSGSCFDDEHVTPLAEKLPDLRILELWNTNAPADRLVDLAMNLPKLQELDVNKVFTIYNLTYLVEHPSLVKLRCSRPLIKSVSNSEFETAAGRLAPVATPQTLYASGACRFDGDGFRGSLFYHWSAELWPRLQMSNLRPAGKRDHDDDENYTLFGPEIILCRSALKRSYNDAAALGDPIVISSDSD